MPQIRVSANRVSASNDGSPSSRSPQEATHGQILGLRNSLREVNLQLSAMAQQLGEERQARLDAERRWMAQQSPPDTMPASADLAALLQSLKQSLDHERQQRLRLEADQQSVAQGLTALIQRMDRPSTKQHGVGWPTALGGMVASSLLGGGLVLAGLGLPWLRRTPAAGETPRLSPQLFGLGGRPPADKMMSDGHQTRPATDRLSLHCPAVCWVEVRNAKTSDILYYDLLKGSIEFPIGQGLRVFSGRSDILQIRINDQPATKLSSSRVVASRLIVPPQR